MALSFPVGWMGLGQLAMVTLQAWVVHALALVLSHLGLWPTSMLPLSSEALLRLQDPRLQALLSPEDCAVVVAPLAGQRGLVNAIDRVQLVARDQAHRPALATYILKRNRATSLARRANALLFLPEREARFYHWQGPQSFLLRAHASAVSSWRGESAILLEDVSEQATGINIYCGNQIWGCPELPPERQRDRLDMVLQVARTAATLHAQHWKSPHLREPDLRWLKAWDWYQGRGELQWQLGFECSRQRWQEGKKKLAQEPWLSPRLVQVMDASFAATTWASVQARLQRRDIPWTLSHGDFHASNMFFRHDTEAVAVIDWTEVGLWEPTTDLGQFVISDLPVPFRRAHEAELVRAYWTTLVEGGVDRQAYPWEACWEAYQRFPVERWLLMLALLSDMGLPVVAVHYFHDQVLAFIEDHPVGDVYLLAPALGIWM